MNGLVNKLASSLVTFESSPQGRVAKRAGKNYKISRTRYGDIYTTIINLELLTLIIQTLLRLGDNLEHQ